MEDLIMIPAITINGANTLYHSPKKDDGFNKPTVSAIETIPFISGSLDGQISSNENTARYNVQPLILDQVKLNINIPYKTRLFLECLCSGEINKMHSLNGMYKMLVQGINDDEAQQTEIESALTSKFPEDYENQIRSFFETYQNSENTLQSMYLLYANDHQFHRFYSPVSFIKGILNNVYSGRPVLKHVDTKLHFEYIPVKKSDIHKDWTLLEQDPNCIKGSIVSVNQSVLTLLSAKIETKADLDRWFLMIKEAIPVGRMEFGCFERCSFTESLLKTMGLETKIVKFYRKHCKGYIKFNPKSLYQCNENWLNHRICAVKLPRSDELYGLDFPYNETIPLSCHPNLYEENIYFIVTPEPTCTPISQDESDGWKTIHYFQNEWRIEQRSDENFYAADKPRQSEYYKKMTWDNKSRKWINNACSKTFEVHNSPPLCAPV